MRAQTRNVKVTAHLASPIAGEPPMLDALLEWVMGRHMPAVLDSANGKRHERIGGRDLIPIPIKRGKVGGWLIPYASSPILPACRESVEHFSKRTEPRPESLAPKRRVQINTTGGEFKSYRLPLRVRNADRVVWFAVANRDSSKGGSAMGRLRQRLRGVHGIGSKVAHGYGQVSRWEVEPVDEDWSWYAPSDTGRVLMRPLPSGDHLPGDLVGYRQWYDAPCGPYWEASNYTEVVQPC